MTALVDALAPFVDDTLDWDGEPWVYAPMAHVADAITTWLAGELAGDAMRDAVAEALLIAPNAECFDRDMAADLATAALASVRDALAAGA